MSVSIRLALAKKVDDPDSVVTYTYDNCDIEQIGFNGRFVDIHQGFGFGLMYQDIINAKRVDFIKFIDPIITHRLQRAFISRRKFRKLDLMIVEGTSGNEIRFRDVKVTSFKQKFEAKNTIIGQIPLMMDIVTIEAGYID